MKRIDPEVRRYLSSLPVISVGQADDCVIETVVHIPDSVSVRVWVSRVDGSVELEIYHGGEWVTFSGGNLPRTVFALALRENGYTGGGL